MASTHTSTQVNGLGPLDLVPGLNVQRVLFTLGTDSTLSLSTDDVIQMVAVPHGARILDVIVKARVGNTEGAASVGDGSSTARYIAAFSLTATPAPVARLDSAGGAGFRYSISSTVITEPKFDTIDISMAGAWTSTRTAVFEMTVYYLMDRDPA